MEGEGRWGGMGWKGVEASKERDETVKEGKRVVEGEGREGREWIYFVSA